jgi:hypothetical protein
MLALKRKHKGFASSVNFVWTSCADTDDGDRYSGLLESLERVEDGDKLNVKAISEFLCTHVANAIGESLDFCAFDFAAKLQGCFSGCVDENMLALRNKHEFYVDILAPFKNHVMLTDFVMGRAIRIVALLDEIAAIVAQVCPEGQVAAQQEQSTAITTSSFAKSELGDVTGARTLVFIDRLISMFRIGIHRLAALDSDIHSDTDILLYPIPHPSDSDVIPDSDSARLRPFPLSDSDYVIV